MGACWHAGDYIAKGSDSPLPSKALNSVSPHERLDLMSPSNHGGKLIAPSCTGLAVGRTQYKPCTDGEFVRCDPSVFYYYTSTNTSLVKQVIIILRKYQKWSSFQCWFSLPASTIFVCAHPGPCLSFYISGLLVHLLHFVSSSHSILYHTMKWLNITFIIATLWIKGFYWLLLARSIKA